MHNDQHAQRKPWSLDFVAEPEEVAALRRLMRIHLRLWGLPEVVEDANLCVTELVSNVLAHVGAGTPTRLAFSMNGPHLRIEIQDPDTQALPVLLQGGVDSEGGRGMALVDATAVRWGVDLRGDCKVTWCELAAERCPPVSKQVTPRLSSAEGLLGLYGAEAVSSGTTTALPRLGLARAEAAAIDIIADLLHWLHTHGRDADDLLDRAQMHFEGKAHLSA